MKKTSSYLEELPPLAADDFAAYGDVEVIPLSKIQKLTGAFLARNWVTIPHVTHHDDIDISALDAFRKGATRADSKTLSPLPFLVKAVVAALKAHPKFNGSLDPENKTFVLKKYYNIGMATDTPNGLLVPVLRNCDERNLYEVAADIAQFADKARTKGLPMSDMSGGTFTISSLGALGGTGFSPIINAPEVAILGVGRSRLRAAPEEDGSIVWRTILPLSLSYDHRLVNGADAGKFMATMSEKLAAPETL